MKILVVSSEAVPFAKTGGMGDVLGALPKAFAKQQHEVKLFLPFYPSVSRSGYGIEPLKWSLNIDIVDKSYPFNVVVAKEKKLPLEYGFIQNSHFFGRDGIYRDNNGHKDYSDNDERFIFFNRAILETLKKINWKPDIIHIHDWQAGLIPTYLKTLYSKDFFFKGIKTVLTIHNLAYQGTFEKEKFSNLGLPESLFYPASPFEFYGKVNFLKAAIFYTDKITTVSEKYAQEIQTEELGCGLDGVLRERGNDIVGILNGVDYNIWSPSRDKKIPYKYYPANLSGKKMNKIELLGEAGLPIREKTPLIGIISRLADQKGFDLIEKVADEIFQLNLQMILLGTGEKKYHQLFSQLEQKYPDKLKVYLTFDDELAHKIEAAADIFLMPSQFEPCGLNQMFSLKYGTIPIVREVGGLADTVKNYNPETQEGNGFVFKEYSANAMLKTIVRAVNLFSKRRLWIKIMKAGMIENFSWDKSAEKYLSLFEQLIK